MSDLNRRMKNMFFVVETHHMRLAHEGI